MLDDTPDLPAILIDAKELKTQLPKPSEFKIGGFPLQVGYEPGARELDAGTLVFRWGQSERRCRAVADKGTIGTYPDVVSLIDGTKNDPVITNEAVCYNPSFLADIAKEAKLINKDRFVKIQAGATPLKPALFTTKNVDHGITYEGLLMTVRES